ncbi:Hydroxymethylglutaryl-coenzyme A synthase, partial [Ancylostoma ceylanicum]
MEQKTLSEGVDVKNACFGGTQAIFHAIDWIYANYATEKRNAIAVLADIAIYAPGPARATGGAGAVAVLITPNAPVAFDRGLRACHMTSAWDFYKPIGKLSTEYPTVDGPVSLQSYMIALDGCYRSYKEKVLRISEQNREVMKCLLKGSEELWKNKTCPFLELNRRIGNMYTPSLFAQLVAYIASGHSDELNRILFFAYGSGSAAAMFSATLNVSSSVYQRMMEISRRAIARLGERHICTPDQYTDALKMREEFLASD